MVYENNDRLIEKGKRVRAVLYYKDLIDNNFYFLLLKRRSIRNPGWEFVKEGFDKRKDKTIEDTLYRGLIEETGILEKDFVNEPKLLDILDVIVYANKIQIVDTYNIEVRNPPSDVVLSEEHSEFKWCDVAESCEKLVDRPDKRKRDLFIFLEILKKEFLERASVLN